MSLEFSHNQEDWCVHGTLAVELPTKRDLENIFMTHSNKTLLRVGVSIKSPKDNFEKKVGRDVATKRLAPVGFTLDHIVQEGTTHLFCFTSENLELNGVNYYLSVCFTTVAESEKVRMIQGDICHMEKPCYGCP